VFVPCKPFQLSAIFILARTEPTQVQHLTMPRSKGEVNSTNIRRGRKWLLVTNIIELKSSLLLKIFLELHKHYDYLQSTLKQKLFTEDIKNAKQWGLGWTDLEILGSNAKVCKWVEDCLTKSRESWSIATICNWSKLSQDTNTLAYCAGASMVTKMHWQQKSTFLRKDPKFRWLCFSIFTEVPTSKKNYYFTGVRLGWVSLF